VGDRRLCSNGCFRTLKYGKHAYRTKMKKKFVKKKKISEIFE